MKMTIDEHVFGIGFKSWGILVFWWIWLLSLLLRLDRWWWYSFELLCNFPLSFGTTGSCIGNFPVSVSQIRWDCLLWFLYRYLKFVEIVYCVYRFLYRYLKFVEIVYCVYLNVEPCLWTAKQVCSVVYHVSKVTELVWHALIQSFTWLNIVLSH